MHKKIFLLTAVFVCIIGGVYFGIIKRFSQHAFNDYCAFCDSTVLENQKFYEDNLVLALYSHKPIFPGHCLIISKRHVERFEMLTDEEITQIGRVIKKVNEAVIKVFGTSSYLLLQKNGLEVGQSVPHVHVHYVPRKAGHDSTLELIVKMYFSHAKQPISQEQMLDTIIQLNEAMQ